MTIRFFLIFALLLLGSRAYEQMTTDQTVAPSFNYRRDFKSIFDSTQESSSPIYYHKLIRRFLDNDSSLTNPEVLALMIGYTNNPSFKPLYERNFQEFFLLNEKNKHSHPAMKESPPKGVIAPKKR